MSNWYITPSNDDLQHHGILGMHWGVRRYQNKDGSYTSAGKRRYYTEDFKNQYKSDYNKINNREITKRKNNDKDYKTLQDKVWNVRQEEDERYEDWLEAEGADKGEMLWKAYMKTQDKRDILEEKYRKYEDRIKNEVSKKVEEAMKKNMGK